MESVLIEQSGVPVDPTASDTPRWGWRDLVVAFLAAQVLSVIGFLVFTTVKGTPGGEFSSDDLSIGELALLQIPLWTGLLVIPWVATTMRGNGIVRDLGLRMVARDIPIGLALGVACQLILVPLVTLPVFLLTDADSDELSAPARELTDKAEGAGVLVLALVVVVMAPLAEEVFYRGMLQRTLRRSRPAWVGIVVTAALFGISHLQPLQLPALFAFGLVLGWLAERTGRLGRNIWAHVGFNLTTIVFLLA